MSRSSRRRMALAALFRHDRASRSRAPAATRRACKIIMIARPVWCLVPGEGRRSHAIFVSRMHELFGGQRRAAGTLSLLHPTVGRLESGPRHHVQLRYLRCHAVLQRAAQGKSRIRDRPEILSLVGPESNSDPPPGTREYTPRAHWLVSVRVDHKKEILDKEA